MIIDKMFEANFTHQLTGLVQLDRETLRYMALHSKKMNEKCETIVNMFDEIADKQKELRVEEQQNEEFRSKLVELSETEARLRQQITKIKKKHVDVSNIKGDILSTDDEKIYTKDVFKMKLLSAMTKLRYSTSKVNGLVSVDVYTYQDGDFNEFVHELQAIEAKQNVAPLLWEHVKQASPHFDKWRELFPTPPTSDSDGS